MVANKDSDRQKCGNILINIRTIKNKNKIFTFHCAFCSTDCDQLKKFSKHLEEEHLHHFEDELECENEEIKCPTPLFQPEEIKVEAELDIEPCNVGDKKVFNISASSDVHEDPLETDKTQKNLWDKECYDQEKVKKEHDGSGREEKEGCAAETCIINETTNILEKSNKFVLKDFSTDEFSDDSNDVDFDVEEECKTVIRSKKENKTRKKDNMETNKNTVKDTNETSLSKKTKRRRRTIIENILPILIQQYKKYEILWQVNNIAFGVINKKFEVYGKIAEHLKLEKNGNMSLDDIKYHIKYLNEMYSKDKEQELKCKLEKKEFVPAYEYYTEMSFLSDSQGPFLCSICNEILPKYDPYCQHMAQHNGTQPFKCPSCEMMFTNYHKYLIHKKRHLGIYNFHCSICGKGYLFKNDLEWHVTSHTGDKPYLCQICGTGFRARHGYDNHIRRHEERFRHECHICKRGFNQLHALNNHVKSHLNIRDVICKICGKGFVHTKYLKRHELIHGDVKNYKCNECGKAFFQACGLRAHRKNHHS